MAAAGALGMAGIALQAYGAGTAYDTSRYAAKARKAAAEFEAKQLEQNAGQALSVAQRQAVETERIGKYTGSRAQAVAAASGGAATDPTAINTIATLAGETAYRKSLDLYQGEERARQLRLAAQATRMSGDISAAAIKEQGNAAVIQGVSGIVSSGTRAYRPTSSPLDAGPSMYGRYGYRDPASLDFTDINRQAAAGYN